MSNMKAKTINLLLEDGSLNGVISMEDTNWNAGELYSAPRESVNNLLKTDAVSKYGVYLLISENMVYVGQSSDLKHRIQQHLVGKDWWERVIILTTTDDKLNKSDIDYLEFMLINKAMKNNKLDCDNKCKGNTPKVSKFNEVFLGQYLEEALFLLELIGITVFSESSNNAENKSNGALITSVKDTDASGREIRAKGATKEFLAEQGIEIGKIWTYASRQEKSNHFWANPHKEYVEQDWTIVLNNQYKSLITIMKIPANTFEIDRYKPEIALRLRTDKDLIDLKIDSETFIDKVSKVNFSKYIVKKINY